jgi:recombination protein RecA
MHPPLWHLPQLSGRLVELQSSGSTAALTLAFRIVLDAQLQGEPVAWITGRSSLFFPPDVAAGGVDLAALAVVRLPSPDDIVRAADLLARSGAFALLVVDLAPGARVPLPLQTRLLGLARKHDTAVLCLTHAKSGTSPLGSLVSLRGETWRRRSAPGAFSCGIDVVKDKRRGLGWKHVEVCRGPAGLR